MHYQVKLQNIQQKDYLIEKINKDASYYDASQIIKHSTKKQFLFICKNDIEAQKFQQQLNFYCQNCQILLFPAFDTTPYDKLSPKNNICFNRIKTLKEITKNNPQKQIIITTINSILQKTIPINTAKNLGIKLKINDEINTEKLIKTNALH